MPTSNLSAPVNKTDERLSKVEARLASSWALRPRSEFETDFRARIKRDLLLYADGVILTAMAVLGLVAYLFIRAATLDVYGSQHQQIISDLHQRYENSVAKGRTQFGWGKQHRYGAKYASLLDFYFRSYIGAKQKQDQMGLIFSRAETYLFYARRLDPQQATTYFEIGELHYTYPKQYHRRDWLDVDKALYFYRESARYCSATEVARGQRADAYRRIGEIYFDKAGAASVPQRFIHSLETARHYLGEAQSEYKEKQPVHQAQETDERSKEAGIPDQSPPEGPSRNQGSIAEVETLLSRVDALLSRRSSNIDAVIRTAWALDPGGLSN